MAAKDITKMTDDDLMTEWTALGAKVEQDKERLRAFSKEHQKRSRLAQLNLEPGDLELLQGVTVEGIASEERVSNNG